MGSIGLMEKRFKPRKMLTGLLPGPIVTPSGEKVNCKPVDISVDGLGILSEALMKEEDRLILRTQNLEIELEVTFSKPDFGKRNLYRYGLKTKDLEINLEEIFTASGCLK